MLHDGDRQELVVSENHRLCLMKYFNYTDIPFGLTFVQWEDKMKCGQFLFGQDPQAVHPATSPFSYCCPAAAIQPVRNAPCRKIYEKEPKAKSEKYNMNVSSLLTERSKLSCSLLVSLLPFTRTYSICISL